MVWLSLLAVLGAPEPGRAAESLRVKFAPSVLDCNTQRGCEPEGPAPEIVTLEPRDCTESPGFRVCTATHFAKFKGYGREFAAGVTLFSYENPEEKSKYWSISASVHRADYTNQASVSLKLSELKLAQTLNLAMPADQKVDPQDPTYYSATLGFGPAD